MSDREALEWALEGLGSALPSDADQFAFHDALKTTMAAARKHLAQLPDSNHFYPQETVDLIAKALHEADTFESFTYLAVAVLDALNEAPE